MDFAIAFVTGLFALMVAGFAGMQARDAANKTRALALELKARDERHAHGHVIHESVLRVAAETRLHLVRMSSEASIEFLRAASAALDRAYDTAVTMRHYPNDREGISGQVERMDHARAELNQAGVFVEPALDDVTRVVRLSCFAVIDGLVSTSVSREERLHFYERHAAEATAALNAFRRQLSESKARWWGELSRGDVGTLEVDDV